MALWGTPLIARRPFPRPTPTPWSLPAPPLRPLSLSPSAMRGLTPQWGPRHSSGMNPRAWREMGAESCWVSGWGERKRGLEKDLLPACLPCTPCLPASLLGHATKSFPSSPSKGGACPSRAKMSMTGAAKSPPSVQSLAMRLLSMPGAQGTAAAGPEPPPATTAGQEGQPKVHRARKTMSKPGNGQVRLWRLGGENGESLDGPFFALFFFVVGFFFSLLPGFSLGPLVFRFFFRIYQ